MLKGRIELPVFEVKFDRDPCGVPNNKANEISCFAGDLERYRSPIAIRLCPCWSFP